MEVAVEKHIFGCGHITLFITVNTFDTLFVITVDTKRGIATMQDIEIFYDDKCEDKTSKLLQYIFKWICSEYQSIAYLMIVDKTYYIDNYDIYVSPEMMLITEGRTWYSKSLGALPLPETEVLLDIYMEVHKKNISHHLPLESWLPNNIAATLVDLGIPVRIFGSHWYIPRQVAMEYPVDQTLIVSKRIPKCYIDC